MQLCFYELTFIESDPCIWGGGVLGQKKPKNLPPSRTTSMPNFVLIRPAIWISVENTQTHRHTHIALYVLDWIEKRTKINKKGKGLPHIKERHWPIIQNVLGSLSLQLNYVVPQTYLHNFFISTKPNREMDQTFCREKSLNGTLTVRPIFCMDQTDRFLFIFIIFSIKWQVQNVTL